MGQGGPRTRRRSAGDGNRKIFEDMKKIVVDHGIRKRLKEEGYGSYPTIRAALNCECNSDVAKRIRQRALHLGGVVLEAERVRMGVEPALVEE